MSTAVVSHAQPEQILKGLGKVWTSLGQEEKQQGAPTVLRACAMTLIVATDEPDAGFAASQTISELMREHPSRGIVIAVAEEAQKEFEARVLAQCWKPFGKAQQICCEQIEIKACPSNWPNVSPILIGLTVADLPVVFWCRHSEALYASATGAQKSGLESIMDLATKVIVDSHGIKAEDAFSSISRWQAEGRVIADLEWTRLTPWREPIGHIFDNPARENKVSNFKTIEVSHTEEAPPVGAIYVAGWLSAPNSARVIFRRVQGYGPGIHSIKMLSDTETITFERTGLDCMTLQSTNGRSRRYGYTDGSVTTLMTEELSVIGPDPYFNAAFRRAQELVSGAN
jgi:glucose-6-phosphate dehydrogenase assembly protein OpcA